MEGREGREGKGKDKKGGGFKEGRKPKGERG